MLSFIMQFSYVLIILTIFLFSTLGLFFSPFKRALQSRPLLYAILAVVVIYIPWDIIVTGNFWYFSAQKTLPVRIAGLPLEEILFFIIVPYALLVIYTNMKSLTKSMVTNVSKYAGIIVPSILFVTVLALLLVWAEWYSVTIILVAALTTFIAWLVQYKHEIPKALIPTLIATVVLTLVFNGLITGLEIVTYNPQMIQGIFIGKIPMEDLLYGYSMILLAITTYDFAERKYAR